MDLLLLIGIAASLLVLIVTILFLKRKDPEKAAVPVHQGQVRVPLPAQEGVPRRAQIARNQRNRIRAAVPAQDEDANSNEEDNENEIPAADISGEKMGAKKRAKLEAKAAKKVQRETDVKEREEKKKREAQLDELKRKHDELAEVEEKKRENAERLEREELERKEHEEYLKLKATFALEEEGFEETEEKNENLVQEFVSYIKTNKVIIIEDLANHFKMKTQMAIDKITELKKNNTITGVIDDRGKFIFISEDELKSIAKFIRQRGRVTITELAENSTNLISLAPVSTT